MIYSPQKKIFYLFFILDCLLVFGVFVGFLINSYRLIIEIEPEIEDYEINFHLNLAEKTDKETIEGKVIEKIIESEEKFKPKNTWFFEDYAQGEVTIYNKTNFDQLLVKKTRLLSPENLVFRTQEKIIVPRGGEIKVLVKADEKGEN